MTDFWLTKKRSRASKTDIDDINETEYKDRTLIQWLNVNKEGLVLICNNLNLNSRGDTGDEWVTEQQAAMI